MKHLFFSAAAVAILASGAFSGAAVAADQPSSVAVPSRMGPWGFDLAGRDTATAPGADFFQYANGTYMKSLVIPPDRSRYGTFDALTVLSENRVRALLDEASANTAASGDEAMIGAFYKAFLDETRVEARDDKPLADDLAAIRAAQDRTALGALMGKANKGYHGAVFGVGISADAKAPTKYAVYLGQAGLGLPDRDYYLAAGFAPQKAKYQAYVAQMLGAVNWPDAQAQAKAIVDFETAIAQASWSKAEQRDPVKTYNAMTPADLAAAAPGFPWAAYLAAADLRSVDRVVVAEKTAFPKIAAIFAQTPIATLRAWQAFNVADNASPFLSKRFADANFEFRNKTLSGQPEQKPRWKRAEAVINSQVGEAVGKIYVARYFPPESKARMEALIGGLRTALSARIERVAWMSPATKAKAQEKLAKFTVKVGYPVKWRDYGALTISADDLYGDVGRANAFEWARQVGRLNQPVDRDEWGITPQTVNAYYNPTQNEIVFPAAILPAAFLRSIRGPGGQLWRHRRGDRPRDDSRLR